MGIVNAIVPEFSVFFKKKVRVERSAKILFTFFVNAERNTPFFLNFVGRKA